MCTGIVVCVCLRVLTAQLLSHVQLCDPTDSTCPAPLSKGFSRQEYCSGLPFPSPGIVLTQGLSRHLLHCRQILYPSVTREALNQLYNSKHRNNRELLFLQCLWVSTLPWACGRPCLSRGVWCFTRRTASVCT